MSGLITSTTKSTASLSLGHLLPGVALDDLLVITRQAGQAIMAVYAQEFSVDYKDDQSPLTQADRDAHRVIKDGLKRITPDIPVLSEESLEVPFEERSDWQQFWLVDPLDGTKEFVKKNDEFTVNIALIKNGHPVFGIIYAPALDELFFGGQGWGAYGVESVDSLAVPLTPSGYPQANQGHTLRVLGSRSHPSEAFAAYLAEKEQQYAEIVVMPAGSALKFCRVAQGVADVYPRLGPTMEWDTGAGHAICEGAGKTVMVYPELSPLTYNKPVLKNPWFICQ